MTRLVRVSSWAARGIILCLLGCGMLVTAVAVRDGIALSDRVTRDLGVWGWVLYVVVVGGAALQPIAAFAVLRGRVGRWGDVRRAFVLFVLCAITYMLLFTGSDGLSVELFLAGWGGAVGTSVLVSTRIVDGKPSRTSFWLFQLCLTLVLLELGLRAIGELAPNPLLVPSDSSVLQRIEAHSVAPGFVHLGFPHNSAGFYDDEFQPAVQRSSPMVAVIGDSFSLSVVPHRAHYTTVCEKLLGDTVVYNVGVGACGPEEYRELLVTDVRPLEPDAVVVAVFVGNDLHDLRLHMVGKRARSWLDRGNCRLLLIAARVLKLARERRRGGAMWGNDSRRLDTEEEIVAAYPWFVDPRRDQPAMSEEAYMELVRIRIPTACRPQPARIRALLDVLLSMRALAGKPFGVVLLPAEFQVEDRVWEEALAGLDGDGYDRDEPQRSVLAALRAAGVPCLDLLPRFRAAEPFDDGDRHLYRPRDTHFGVIGNRIAGEELAPFVRRLLKQVRAR